MRKNFKLLGAVAVAGIVATTGSAFTAGNTVAADKKFGFGSTSVSGATTEAMVFVADTGGDASKADSIDYTLTLTDTTTPENAVATLKYGRDTATLTTVTTCTITASVPGGATPTKGSIKCANDYLVADLVVVQLVVTPKTA